MKAAPLLLILLLVVAGALLPLLAIHLRGVWETCPSPATGETGGWACELQLTLIERGWLSPVSFHTGSIGPNQQHAGQSGSGQQQGVQSRPGVVSDKESSDKQQEQREKGQQQQQEQEEKREQQLQQQQQRQRREQEGQREHEEQEQQQQQQQRERQKREKQQQQQREQEEEEVEEQEAKRQEQQQQQQQRQRQQQQKRGHENADVSRSPEDIERILKYPYVEDCNLCKVCIPTHVVAHHPKAQARLKARGLETVQTADPDVMIEVKTKSRLEKEQQSRDLDERANKQGDTDGDSKEQRKLLLAREGLYRIRGQFVDISGIAPGMKVAEWRAKKPNCPVCWGCTHTLHSMAKGVRLLGSYYAHEPGGSPSWLFKVPTNRTQSGWAVVKVWCVPVVKPLQQALGHCQPPKVMSQAKLVLAQHKLTAECGFSDIVPKLWIEPVNGVIPGHGFHINWLGLWSDVADGVSIENIKEHGKPHLDPDVLLDLFQNKLNHTEVKLAALFDLFTSQCDRHQQNYFLNEHGKLWAIDNDQVYTTAWRHCGVDSLVLPTTQKFMINHLGWGYVMKFPHQNPPTTWANDQHLLSLLDYRCHTGTPDGTIGFDYPPALRQCMTRLSGMLPSQIASQYGFPDMRLAEAFRNRSTSLLRKGFEWTLMYGEPLNSPPHRYKVAPKCCSLTRLPNSRLYRCARPEGPKQHQLPYGNPSTGGKWLAAPEKDTGSYEGGTSFY